MPALPPTSTVARPGEEQRTLPGLVGHYLRGWELHQQRARHTGRMGQHQSWGVCAEGRAWRVGFLEDAWDLLERSEDEGGWYGD